MRERGPSAYAGKALASKPSSGESTNTQLQVKFKQRVVAPRLKDRAERKSPMLNQKSMNASLHGAIVRSRSSPGSEDVALDVAHHERAMVLQRRRALTTAEKVLQKAQRTCQQECKGDMAVTHRC
jgi:hypothetical protein